VFDLKGKPREVITLSKVQEIVEALNLVGEKDVVLSKVDVIENADEESVIFARDLSVVRKIKDNGRKVGALIVSERTWSDIEKNNGSLKDVARAFVVVKNADLAFAKLLEHFYPFEHPVKDISSNAKIASNVEIGEDVRIGDFAVIESGVKIGRGTIIYPHVYIGVGVEIGEDCVIYPNVTLREFSKIGNRVIIHSGTVIGSDGYGYTRAEDGFYKIPQRGRVVIEDDVEIGANVTVDRGTFGDTVIGKGTKIDNLVHVGHNVKIGHECLIVAQVGIAGSTKIGNRVKLAGQSGVSGHIEIGDDVTVTAKGGVINNVPAGQTVSGYPAIPHMKFLRIQKVLEKLPELFKILKELAQADYL